MEKKCFKCGLVKKVKEFYRHPEMKDGYLNKCKICARKDVSENYFKNHGYYREYDFKRARDKKRVDAVKKNTERLKKYERHKITEYKRKYSKKQKNATIKVQRAIKNNLIIKKPCIICGRKDSQGHHEDYNKPLEVIWLCPEHHAIVHRAKRYISILKEKGELKLKNITGDNK